VKESDSGGSSTHREEATSNDHWNVVSERQSAAHVAAEELTTVLNNIKVRKDVLSTSNYENI